MQIEVIVSKAERAVLILASYWSLLFLISFCLLISACASHQENKTWDPLRHTQATDQGISRQTSNLPPAVAILIKQADLKIEQKQWSSAISMIERALRISSRQAEVWTRMAIAHLGNDNAEQAIHMAKRSNGYAGNDFKLKSYNWLLMSRAYYKLNQLNAAEAAAFKSKKLIRENS